jgi:adenine-specific DNA-methyltransferase
MAAIHDLIAQMADARLRERLAAEWARATRERKFGLVFEDHLPELLPLPKARPRTGDRVALRGGPLQDLWHPFVASSRGCIEDLIQPHETRKRICRSLPMRDDTQLASLWRQHGNIPL